MDQYSQQELADQMDIHLPQLKRSRLADVVVNSEQEDQMDMQQFEKNLSNVVQQESRFRTWLRKKRRLPLGSRDFVSAQINSLSPDRDQAQQACASPTSSSTTNETEKSTITFESSLSNCKSQITIKARESSTSTSSTSNESRKSTITSESSLSNCKPQIINSSDNSPLPSVQEEGDLLYECAEFSANPTSPAQAELMRFAIELSEAFNQAVMSDAQCSILQESKLPSSIPTLASPIESADGIQLLLTLENTYLGKSICVGAVVHAMPSEILEFYFFNAKDMAICVGVGLPQAKVILHNDLSITIEKTTISESELKDTWMPSSCLHLVMKVNMEASDMQAVNGDVPVQAFGSERAETLSQLYGVGFDGGSQYIIVDETYDAAEVSWPLLYDMALFILKRNDVQCNETNGTSNSQGSGSLQGNNPDNSMVHKLHGKHNSLFNSRNMQGAAGGDGDEDEISGDAEEDDDPPVVLIIRVHPLPKFDILYTHANPVGLDRACISPELVFEFRLNRRCRRISIKADTQLDVVSQIHNTNLFGWYHTNIQIDFGCEDTQGYGRVALLKPNTSRILNEKTAYKYTRTNSSSCSKANTLKAGALGGFKIGSLLGSIDLQGSASTSRMNQQTTSNGGNMEMVHECICEGFSFKNISLAESPARARFFLSYPLENTSIWDDTEYLKNRGLFQTIAPSIKATWIPLNEDDASPYSFKVERSLRLHQRGDGLEGDYVLDHKQEYILSFLVNHAMTHLPRSRKNKPIDLYGDQQSVPSVLAVGAVY